MGKSQTAVDSIEFSGSSSCILATVHQQQLPTSSRVLVDQYLAKDFEQPKTTNQGVVKYAFRSVQDYENRVQSMINQEQRNIKKQMMLRKNQEFQTCKSQRKMQSLNSEQGLREERRDFSQQPDR